MKSAPTNSKTKFILLLLLILCVPLGCGKKINEDQLTAQIEEDKKRMAVTAADAAARKEKADALAKQQEKDFLEKNSFTEKEVNVWTDVRLANKNVVLVDDMNFSAVARKYEITEDEAYEIFQKVKGEWFDYKTNLSFYENLAKAEKGDPDALYKLGAMYGFGFTPEGRNEEEALKCFKKASELGHPKAQMQIASFYFFGFTSGITAVEVKIDKVLGYAWQELAIKNGAGEIAIDGSEYGMKPKMTPEQIAKAEELLKEMVKKNPKLLNK